MTYAQLDENNVVVGVSQLYEKVDYPNMIEIPSMDEELLGAVYKDGEFILQPKVEASQHLEETYQNPTERMEAILTKLEKLLEDKGDVSR